MPVVIKIIVKFEQRNLRASRSTQHGKFLKLSINVFLQIFNSISAVAATLMTNSNELSHFLFSSNGFYFYLSRHNSNRVLLQMYSKYFGYIRRA